MKGEYDKNQCSMSTAYALAGKPSTSYSSITQIISRYSESEKRMVVLSAYNSPVDQVLKMIGDNPTKSPDEIDWAHIISNRGFWLHLAERDLKPILKSFFCGDSL